MPEESGGFSYQQGYEPSSEPETTVFYSYSSVDRSRVTEFAKLSQFFGEKPFVDHKTIKPGSKWQAALQRGLDESKRMVVFWTRHSARSKWVRREYEYFASTFSDRPLLPVLADDTEPSELLAKFQVITLEASEPGAGVELDLDRGGGGGGAPGLAGFMSSLFGMVKDMRDLGRSKAEIRRAVLAQAKKVCGGERLPMSKQALFYAVSPNWLASPLSPATWPARAKSAANWVKEAVSHLTRPQWAIALIVLALAAALASLPTPTKDPPAVDGVPPRGVELPAPSPDLTRAVDSLSSQVNLLAGILLRLAPPGETDPTAPADPAERVGLVAALREQTRVIGEWRDASARTSEELRQAVEAVQLSAPDLPTRQQMDRLIEALSGLELAGGGSPELTAILRSLRDCSCAQTPSPEAPVSSLEILDFEGVPDGHFASSGGPLQLRGALLDREPRLERSFPILIEGTPHVGGRNAAVILDSSSPPGDLDLGSPSSTCRPRPGVGRGEGGRDVEGNPFRNCSSLRNLLIVSGGLVDRDGDGTVDTPNDVDDPRAQLTVDFSRLPARTATVHRIDFLDAEAGAMPVEVRLLGPSGTPVGEPIWVPRTGDNGYLRICLGPTAGVQKVEVRLNGSGAVDNLVFDPGPS